MKDEYIRKQDAANVVANTAKIVASFNYQYAIDALLALTPADVAPVRHARWEHVKHKSVEHGEIVIDGETVRCSDCRHAEKGWNAGMDFCPNCGAKMRGEQE